MLISGDNCVLISGVISVLNSVVNAVYASVPNDGTKQYQHSLQGGLHVTLLATLPCTFSTASGFLLALLFPELTYTNIILPNLSNLILSNLLYTVLILSILCYGVRYVVRNDIRNGDRNGKY